LKPDAEGYSIIDGKDSSAARQSVASNNRGSQGFSNFNQAPTINQFDEIIDRMGAASSKA